MAIFVAATLVSAVAGAIGCSDAAVPDAIASASFAGGSGCGEAGSVDATLVSASGAAVLVVSATAPAGAASVGWVLSIAASGLAAAGTDVSVSCGFSAAICSGPSGAATLTGGGATLADSAGAAMPTTGPLSDFCSGSTRSIASTGLVASAACAKLAAGAACQEGLLANCSWAARSSAVAPRPNTSIDIDKTIAANRKRKPGSMGR